MYVLWFKWHTWWVCPRLLSSFVPFLFETRSMATLSTRWLHVFCSLHTVLWNHGSSLTSWGSRKLTLAWTLEGSLCDPHINLLTNSSLETETRQCAKFRVIPYCTRRSRKARKLSFCTTFVWPTTRMSSKRNFTSCGQAPFDNRLNINLQKGMINVVSLRVSGSRST